MQQQMDLTEPPDAGALDYVMARPKKTNLFSFPGGADRCAYCHILGHAAEDCAERMMAERAANALAATQISPSNEGGKQVVAALEPAPNPGHRAIEPIVLPKLVAPIGVSKSMLRALECPTFFVGQYLQRVAEAEHFLARTGKEFHAWRQAYTNHLVDIQMWRDPDFQARYLETEVLSDDARKLIARDDFAIDPDSVYGCEVFLSIDREFRPLEHEIGNPTPGRLSGDPRFLASGTIDLLLLEDNGRKATIRDPKSGFSTTGVTDTEPPVYAALVMLHFPLVQEVNFVWDFVRSSAVRRTSYTREDLSWIEDLLLQKDQLKNDLVRGYNDGETLDANPFSGLCPYCQLTCPLRPRWEAGELALAAPQTRLDAIRLAQLVKVCEDVIGRAKTLVAGWLDQEPSMRLELGAGWEATLRVSETKSLPLYEALHALGLDLIDLSILPADAQKMVADHRPEYTPQFDVPLAQLTLGGLNGFAKTKKSRKRGNAGGVSRENLNAALLAIAKRGATTTVVIHKEGASEVTEQLLEASLDA